MGFVNYGPGPQGPEGPQGDPGTPGPAGELAPLAPNSQPNAWTNKYLFRVSVGQTFQILIKAYIVRLDSRKRAVFERSLTIGENAASPGTAELPFALEPIKADQKQTGALGMSTASISQAIAPGDPASVEVTVSGPAGVACKIQVYIQTDDGINEV